MVRPKRPWHSDALCSYDFNFTYNAIRVHLGVGRIAGLSEYDIEPERAATSGTDSMGAEDR